METNVNWRRLTPTHARTFRSHSTTAFIKLVALQLAFIHLFALDIQIGFHLASSQHICKVKFVCNFLSTCRSSTSNVSFCISEKFETKWDEREKINPIGCQRNHEKREKRKKKLVIIGDMASTFSMRHKRKKKKIWPAIHQNRELKRGAAEQKKNIVNVTHLNVDVNSNKWQMRRRSEVTQFIFDFYSREFSESIVFLFREAFCWRKQPIDSKSIDTISNFVLAAIESKCDASFNEIDSLFSCKEKI